MRQRYFIFLLCLLLAPALAEALAGLPVYTIPVRVALLGAGAAQLRQLLPGASPGSPVLL